MGHAGKSALSAVLVAMLGIVLLPPENSPAHAQISSTVVQFSVESSGSNYGDTPKVAPDGKTAVVPIFTPSEDFMEESFILSRVRLIDLTNPTRDETLDVPPGNFSREPVAFSNDGSFAYLTSVFEVIVIDLRTFTIVETLISPTSEVPLFSPDRRFAFERLGPLFQVFSVETGQFVLGGGPSPIDSVSFSADSNRLYTHSGQTLEILSLPGDTGEQVGPVVTVSLDPNLGEISGIGPESSSGDLLLLSLLNSRDFSYSSAGWVVVNTRNGNVETVIEPDGSDGYSDILGFTADGQYLLGTNYALNQAFVITVSTGERRELTNPNILRGGLGIPLEGEQSNQGVLLSSTQLLEVDWETLDLVSEVLLFPPSSDYDSWSFLRHLRSDQEALIMWEWQDFSSYFGEQGQDIPEPGTITSHYSIERIPLTGENDSELWSIPGNAIGFDSTGSTAYVLRTNNNPLLSLLEIWNLNDRQRAGTFSLFPGSEVGDNQGQPNTFTTLVTGGDDLEVMVSNDARAVYFVVNTQTFDTDYMVVDNFYSVLEVSIESGETNELAKFESVDWGGHGLSSDKSKIWILTTEPFVDQQRIPQINVWSLDLATGEISQSASLPPVPDIFSVRRIFEGLGDTLLFSTSDSVYSVDISTTSSTGSLLFPPNNEMRVLVSPDRKLAVAIADNYETGPEYSAIYQGGALYGGGIVADANAGTNLAPTLSEWGPKVRKAGGFSYTGEVFYLLENDEFVGFQGPNFELVQLGNNRFDFPERLTPLAVVPEPSGDTLWVALGSRNSAEVFYLIPTPQVLDPGISQSEVNIAVEGAIQAWMIPAALFFAGVTGLSVWANRQRQRANPRGGQVI